MIAKISAVMVKFVNRWMPSPLLFAFALSIVVFIWGLFVVEPKNGQNAVLAMIGFGGDGFWNLMVFTMQMAMIVITGTALANARPVKRILKAIASCVKTPAQASAVVCFVVIVATFVQWGFGIVVGALLAKEIARKLDNCDYGLLIASAYIGFMMWGSGISGSMPLSAAQADNVITMKHIGYAIPIMDTVFTSYNIFYLVVCIVLLPILVYFMTPKKPKVVDPALIKESEDYIIELPKDASPAQKFEESRIMAYAVSLVGFIYLANYFYQKGFAGLNLNSVNIMFVILGLAMHGTPMAYMRAVNDAVKGAGGVLMQFPFYAAIAAMMEHSGIAAMITKFFVEVSTETTFPIFTFLSSAVINFAIPSGGGHWAVQGPFILEAAKEISNTPEYLAKATMAIAYGDEWSNMFQPFWALPALAIAGLGVRDIMGYCMTAALFIFPFIVIGLYIF